MGDLPDGWRYLEDEEIITAECICFGRLSNNTIGWAKPPKYLIGEAYCEGSSRHPALIALKSPLKQRRKNGRA